MPKKKSGFKNWQRIIALVLVIVFSFEQIAFAGDFSSDLSRKIKSYSSTISKSLSTSYNSGTQYMRTNFPTAFKAASPLIAAVDLVRGTVTRSSPAFYNSWTQSNRINYPNAARVYDSIRNSTQKISNRISYELFDKRSWKGLSYEPHNVGYAKPLDFNKITPQQKQEAFEQALMATGIGEVGAGLFSIGKLGLALPESLITSSAGRWLATYSIRAAYYEAGLYAFRQSGLEDALIPTASAYRPAWDTTRDYVLPFFIAPGQGGIAKETTKAFFTPGGVKTFAQTGIKYLGNLKSKATLGTLKSVAETLPAKLTRDSIKSGIVNAGKTWAKEAKLGYANLAKEGRVWIPIQMLRQGTHVAQDLAVFSAGTAVASGTLNKAGFKRVNIPLTNIGVDTLEFKDLPSAVNTIAEYSAGGAISGLIFGTAMSVAGPIVGPVVSRTPVLGRFMRWYDNTYGNKLFETAGLEKRLAGNSFLKKQGISFIKKFNRGQNFLAEEFWVFREPLAGAAFSRLPMPAGAREYLEESITDYGKRGTGSISFGLGALKKMQSGEAQKTISETLNSAYGKLIGVGKDISRSIGEIKLPNPLPMVAAPAPGTSVPGTPVTEPPIIQSASTPVSLRGHEVPEAISIAQPTTFNVHTGANAIPLGQSFVGNTPSFVPTGVRSHIGQMSQVQFRNNFGVDTRIKGKELDALANNPESRVDRLIELGFNQHELQQRLGGQPVLFEKNKSDSLAKPAETPKVDSGKIAPNIEAIKPVILDKPILAPVIVPINGKDLAIPQKVIEALFKDKAKITQFNTLPEMKIEQKFEGKDGQVYVLRSGQDSKIKLVTKIVAKYENDWFNFNIPVKDEFEITERLKSNNVRVPTIYDLDEKNNILFMEFIEGQKLGDFLTQAHPQETLNEIAGKIGVEIWKMHEAGVVHRDLHDQNIMVNDKGDPTFIDLSRSAIIDKTNFEDRYRELDRAIDGMEGHVKGGLKYNKEFPVNIVLSTYADLYIEKYGVDEFIKGPNKEIYAEDRSYRFPMGVANMRVALYLKLQAAKRILLEDISEIKGNPAEIGALNNNFLKAEKLLKAVSDARIKNSSMPEFGFHDKTELLRFEQKMFDNIMRPISLGPQTKKLIENRLGLSLTDNTRKTGLSGVIQTIQKLLEPQTELEIELEKAFRPNFLETKKLKFGDLKSKIKKTGDAPQGDTLNVSEEDSPNSQIGKRAEVSEVIVKGIKTYYLKVTDTKGKALAEIWIRPVKKEDLLKPLREFGQAQDSNSKQKEILESFLSLLENSPPEFYTFYETIEDLFGYASKKHNLIALNDELAENPIAIFHEIGEYLIDAGFVELTLNGAAKQIVITNKLTNEKIEIPLTHAHGDVHGAMVLADRHPKNPHYLLRALQRELFREKDTDLTQEIKKRQVPNPIFIDKAKEQESDEARRFLEERIDIKRLQRDFKPIIEYYGYADFKELYLAAGEGASYLYNDGLSFRVQHLFSSPEEFKRYWPDLVRLGKAAGRNARFLFRYELPAIRELFSPEEFKLYWVYLMRLSITASENNIHDLFYEGLPTVKKLITDQNSLNAIGSVLIRWGIAVGGGSNAGYFYKCLHAVGNLISDEKSLNIIGDELVRLAKTAGENLWELSGDGFRAVNGLITDQKSLIIIGNDLIRICVAAGKNAGDLFRRIRPRLEYTFGNEFSQTKWQALTSRIISICNKANDHNRERIIELLFEEPSLLNREEFDFFLDISVKVISEESRLCLQVLEGIKSGIEQGLIIPKNIETSQNEILSFVRLTHSFSPALFSLYKQEGEAGLKEVFLFSEKILYDGIGEEELFELERYLQAKGIKDTDEAIPSVIQIAIPSSGTSFVKKEEIKGLFAKFRKLGDKRGDVPIALRDRDFGDGNALDLMERRLIDGAVFDPKGEVKAIISSLRQRHEGLSKEAIEDAERKDKQAFKQALLAWFSDFQNKEKHAQALEKFYRSASHSDTLKEKVDAISDDYSAVVLLEALFTDKDNLSQMAREVLDTLAETDYPVVAGQKQIPNVAAFAKGVIKVWQKQGLSYEEKEAILQKMLTGYSKTELLDYLRDDSLKQAILRVPEAGARIVKPQIIEALFSKPYASIQQEKAKFTQRKKGEAELEFRVVKGIPYGLWGLNAGVCIATDLELFNKKEFFLLAIIDKTTGKIAGFAHLFEKEINGKKVLTVPGIEPSVEFLSEVKAEELYPLIEQALIKVAKTGGYSSLYLPQDKNILSNRSDITRIALRKYESNKLTLTEPVSWNTLPQPYPFKDVYVIWQAKDASEEKDGRCLTPDSLIHLAGGTKKPLIEIKEGDAVLSLNQETGRLEPHRVNALLDMGVKPVYRLTTQSGKRLKTTLTHPYLTKSGWKKLKDIQAGEEISVLNSTVFSEASYGSFDNLISNKKTASSIEEKQRFFGLFGREPLIMKGISNYTDAPVDLDSQPLAGVSGIEVIGKDYRRGEFIGEIDSISFSGMKLKTLYNLFDSRDNFFFGMGYFEVSPSAYFLNKRCILGVDFRNDAEGSMERGESFEEIEPVNLVKMDKRPGINYDFFHVSGPILYRLEQSYPDARQAAAGQGQQVELPFGARFVSLNIAPAPYLPTFSLSRFQLLQRLPLEAFLDETPLFPSVSRLLRFALDSPLCDLLRQPKLYHKLTAVSNLFEPEVTEQGWKKLKDIKAGEEIRVAVESVSLCPQRYLGNQNIVSLPIKDNPIVSGSEAVDLISFAFDRVGIMQGIIRGEIMPEFFDNKFLDRNWEFSQLPVSVVSEGIADHLIPNRCSIVLEETRPDWRDFSISSQNSGLEYSMDSNKSINASLSKKKPLVFKPFLSETKRTNPLSVFWGLRQSCESFTTFSFNNNDDITIFSPPPTALLLLKLYHKLTAVSNLFEPPSAYAQAVPLRHSEPAVFSGEAKNLKPGLIWDKIVSIEPVGNLAVYDIEVQGTHNFVAEGILAHNTYVSQKTEDKEQKTDDRIQIAEPEKEDPDKTVGKGKTNQQSKRRELFEFFAENNVKWQHSNHNKDILWVDVWNREQAQKIEEKLKQLEIYYKIRELPVGNKQLVSFHIYPLIESSKLYIPAEPIDNIIVILQGEYAISRAEDENPTLATTGIATCKGLLLYDPETKVAALAHIDYDNEIINTLKALLQKLEALNGKRYVLGYTDNLDHIYRKVIEEELKNKLIETIELPRDLSFDTRNGKIDKFPEFLKDKLNQNKNFNLRNDISNYKIEQSISSQFLVYEPINKLADTKSEDKDLVRCLTPDSLIYLAGGTKKPLIEIKEGDEVVSLNQETGRLEPHRVNALLDMGVKPVYKLTTQSGKSLKTTLTHPYLTKSGWKKLKDIKAGEEIRVAEDLSRPDSDFVFFNNKKSSSDFGWFKIVKELKNAVDNFFFAHIFDVNNRHSGRISYVESRDIPEVLVEGKQNVIMGKDVIENNRIGGSDEAGIINRGNFKSLISQGGNNIPINALVGKNSHKDKSGLRDYLSGVFHKLSRVINSGNHIFSSYARVLFGNLFYGVAGAQQVEDIAYRNTGSFNTGLSKPDIGINYDSSFMHNNSTSIQPKLYHKLTAVSNLFELEVTEQGRKKLKDIQAGEEIRIIEGKLGFQASDTGEDKESILGRIEPSLNAGRVYVLDGRNQSIPIELAQLPKLTPNRTFQLSPLVDFGFNSGEAFVNIYGELEFVANGDNLSFQSINPLSNAIDLLIKPFSNIINLFIQPSDFKFNHRHFGFDLLQLRDNHFLDNLFKIYRAHEILLSLPSIREDDYFVKPNFFQPPSAYAQAVPLRHSEPAVFSGEAKNLKPGLIWDKIVSIEPVGNLAVYDIEVEGTHNFLAEGILAHNTYAGGEEQKTDTAAIPSAKLDSADGIYAALRNKAKEYTGQFKGLDDILGFIIENYSLHDRQGNLLPALEIHNSLNQNSLYQNLTEQERAEFLRILDDLRILPLGGMPVHKIAEGDYFINDENAQKYLSHLEHTTNIFDRKRGLGAYEDIYKEIEQITNDVINSLAVETGWKPSQFQLHLVEDYTPNAFIYPFTGHIMVNIGILLLLKQRGHLTKDAVGALIGHEMIHNIQNFRALRDGKISRKEILEEERLISPERLLAGYVNEYDADIHSLRLLSQAGYNPLYGLQLWEDLRYYIMMRSGSDRIHISHPPTLRRIEELRNKFETGYVGDTTIKPRLFSRNSVDEIEIRSHNAQISDRAFLATTAKEVISLIHNTKDIRELISVLMLARIEDENADIMKSLARESLTKALQLAQGDSLKEMLYVALLNNAFDALDSVDKKARDRIRIDRAWKQTGRFSSEDARELNTSNVMRQTASVLRDALRDKIANVLIAAETPQEFKRLAQLFNDLIGIYSSSWNIQSSYFEQMHMREGERLDDAKKHYELAQKRFQDFLTIKGEPMMGSANNPEQTLADMQKVLNEVFAGLPQDALRALSWEEFLALVEAVPTHVKCEDVLKPLFYERARTMSADGFKLFLERSVTLFHGFSTHFIKDDLPIEIIRIRPDLLKTLIQFLQAPSSSRRELRDVKSVILDRIVGYWSNWDIRTSFCEDLTTLASDPNELVEKVLDRFSQYDLRIKTEVIRRLIEHTFYSPSEALQASERSAQILSMTPEGKEFRNNTDYGFNVTKLMLELMAGRLGTGSWNVLIEEDLNTRIRRLLKEKGLNLLFDVAELPFNAKLYLFSKLLLVRYFNSEFKIVDESGYARGKNIQEIVLANLKTEEKIKVLRTFNRLRKATISEETEPIDYAISYIDLLLSLEVPKDNMPFDIAGIAVGWTDDALLPFRHYRQLNEFAYGDKELLYSGGIQLLRQTFPDKIEFKREWEIRSTLNGLVSPLLKTGMTFEILVEKITDIIPPSVFRNYLLMQLWDTSFLPLEKSSEAGSLVLNDRARGSARLIAPYLIHDSSLARFNSERMAGAWGWALSPWTHFDEGAKEKYESEKGGYASILFHTPGSAESQMDIFLGTLVKDHILSVVNSEASFEHKLGVITDYFAQGFSARDEYLVKLLEEAKTIDQFLQLRELFSSQYWKDKAGLKALELDRQGNIDGFKDFDSALSRVLHYFPEPGVLRDDLLGQLLLDYKIGTVEYVVKVNNLMLQASDNLTKDKTQRYFAGSDVFNALISNLKVEQKAELLLWLMGVREEKPEFLQRYEYILKVSFDQIKEMFFVAPAGYFRNAGKSAREQFLQQFFDIDTGIVSSKDGRLAFIREVCADVGIDTGESSVLWKIIRSAFELDSERFTESEQWRTIQRRIILNITNQWVELGKIKSMDRDKREVRFIQIILESTGVVGVKVGQFLSQSNLVAINSELRDGLASLKERAEPINIGTALFIISALRKAHNRVPLEMLGLPVSKASIKNVYAAVEEGTTSGKIFAVKLKRPGIQINLEKEIAFFETLIKALQLEGILPTQVSKEMLREIKRMINEELDFEREAENQRLLSRNNTSKARFLLGKFIDNLFKASSRKVRIPNSTEVYENQMMVEEYVEGLSLGQIRLWKNLYKRGYSYNDVQSAVEQQDSSKLEEVSKTVGLVRGTAELEDLFIKTQEMLVKHNYPVTQLEYLTTSYRSLCRDTAAELMKQFFIDGVFHLDPHEGNILVPMDGNGIYLIDCGAVGRVSLRERIGLLANLLTAKIFNRLSHEEIMKNIKNPQSLKFFGTIEYLFDAFRGK